MPHISEALGPLRWNFWENPGQWRSTKVNFFLKFWHIPQDAAPWPIFQNCEGLLGWDVRNWAWWHKRVNMSSSTRFFFILKAALFCFNFFGIRFRICRCFFFWSLQRSHLKCWKSTPFSASNLEHRDRPAAWCKMGKTWIFFRQDGCFLVAGFKHFLFSFLFGEMIQFD